MNLTWHIVNKDLVRLRLPALLWAVVLAGQVLVSTLLLSNRSVDLNWFNQMGTFFNVLVMVGLMMSYILVAILILDDPLTGTDMFWLTRPIGGGRLLVAKGVVALLLFGVPPFLIWLPWWVHCGFAIHDIALAAGYVLTLQAITVFPAFVLASLVNQLGRFLLFSLLLVFAVLVAWLNLLSYTGLSQQLMQGRLLLAIIVLVPFGLAAIARQYFSRKLVSAVVILVTGVFFALAMVFWWPGNVLKFWPDHREQLRDAAQISGAIHGAQISSSRNSDGSDFDTVIIYLRFSGGPEDSTLSDGLAAVELRWSDGETIRQERLRMVASGDTDPPLRRALSLKPDEERWLHHWDPATSAKQAELHATMIEIGKKYGARINKSKEGSAFVTLFVTVPLTPSQAERIKSDPPACSISARIGAQRPEVLIEMPLKSGMQKAGNGERLHLLGMERTRRLEQGPRKPDWYSTTAVSATAPGFKNNVILYQVNRSHGTVRFLSRNAVFSAAPLASNIACMPISFEPPMLWREDKWIEEPNWLESTTLVSVIYRDAGGFDRNFQADRLRVNKADSDDSASLQP